MYDAQVPYERIAMNQGPAYWELIASKLKGRGWRMSMRTASLGGVDFHFIDARRDEVRHVILADDLLAGFLELEASIAEHAAQ